jgi:Spy/CpxP family protein refolding chaperone
MIWTNRACNAAVILCIAASSMMLGCDESSSSSGAATTASAPAASVSTTAAAAATSTLAGTDVGDDDQGAALIDHHRHHHGGVAMFLSMSIDSLGVSDAEKANIEKIQSDLLAKQEPVHTAQKNLLSVLGDGVAAGKIDDTKVTSAITQIDTASTASESASADALNQLHATLTPPERAALMQKLDAHWSVWKKANADGPPPAAGKPANDRFTALTHDLDLSQDQSDKIRASVTANSASDKDPKFNPGDVDANMKALSTAFQRDTFDAKTLNGAPLGDAHLASRGAKAMAKFYEAAVPILTADQRTKLASRLHDHSAQEAGNNQAAASK